MQTMLVLLLLLLLLVLNGTFQILLLLISRVPPLGRCLLQLLLLLLLRLLLLLVPLRGRCCRHHVGHAQPVVVGRVIGSSCSTARTASRSRGPGTAATVVVGVAGGGGRDLETTRHLVREDLLGLLGLAGGGRCLLLLQERLLLQLLVVHLLLLVLLVEQALVDLRLGRCCPGPPHGAPVFPAAGSCAAPRTTRAMVLRHAVMWCYGRVDVCLEGTAVILWRFCLCVYSNRSNPRLLLYSYTELYYTAHLITRTNDL